MVTLNKKESERFLKKMMQTEKRKPTKKELKLAKEIKRNSKYFELTSDKYLRPNKKAWNNLNNNKKYPAKIVKRFPKAILNSCSDHPLGCYLKLTSEEYDHSKDSVFTIIDYDSYGKIRGIEFPDGL